MIPAKVGPNISPILKDLEQLRVEARITRTELGEYAGIRPTSVANYFIGKAEPPISAVVRLATSLGMALTLRPLTEDELDAVRAASDGN